MPYGGKRGGGIAKKPKMEHDEERWMNVWEREKGGHDCDGGSSAKGAVAVSLKFNLVHLVHLRTVRSTVAWLDRSLGLLRVRELRRRCRPEDDGTIRARRVCFRRHRIRYGMGTRSCLFRTDTAADTYDDKRELGPRRKIMFKLMIHGKCGPRLRTTIPCGCGVEGNIV